MTSISYPFAGSVAQPARTLDTPFQISVSRPALVFYTISMDVTVAGVAGDDAFVALVSDSANPPTTELTRVSNLLNQTVGTGTLNSITQGVLCAFIQPGHFVELVSGGTGTATLDTTLEVVIL